MSPQKKRAPLGERLIHSMERGLAALRNNQPLPLAEVPCPPDPLPFGQKQVMELRHRLHWSQAALAIWLNVSNKTVQSWEQGTRKPSGSALRLLQILDQPVILEQIMPASRMVEATKDRTHVKAKKVHIDP